MEFGICATFDTLCVGNNGKATKLQLGREMKVNCAGRVQNTVSQKSTAQLKEWLNYTAGGRWWMETQKKKKDISCVVLCRVVHETKCIGGGMAGYKLKHGRVSETNASNRRRRKLFKVCLKRMLARRSLLPAPLATPHSSFSLYYVVLVNFVQLCPLYVIFRRLLPSSSHHQPAPAAKGTKNTYMHPLL